MGREIRRVPLNFDWPLNKVWQGFIMPDEMRLKKCPKCGGDGFSIEARAIDQTFYPHQIDGPNADALAWCDKIGQAEVDNLVKSGRLSTTRPRTPTQDDPKDWERVSNPRTAEEINRINRSGGRILMGGHDAINRMILVSFRCEVLGINRKCARCEGRGEIATEAEREAYDNWEQTEPPTGEGWQLWETVSEGSPISPVFATDELMVGYLIEQGHSEHSAREFVKDGWAPSMVIAHGKVLLGIDAAGELK